MRLVQAQPDLLRHVASADLVIDGLLGRVHSRRDESARGWLEEARNKLRTAALWRFTPLGQVVATVATSSLLTAATWTVASLAVVSGLTTWWVVIVTALALPVMLMAVVRLDRRFQRAGARWRLSRVRVEADVRDLHSTRDRTELFRMALGHIDDAARSHLERHHLPAARISAGKAWLTQIDSTMSALSAAQVLTSGAMQIRLGGDLSTGDWDLAAESRSWTWTQRKLLRAAERRAHRACCVTQHQLWRRPVTPEERVEGWTRAGRLGATSYRLREALEPAGTTSMERTGRQAVLLACGVGLVAATGSALGMPLSDVALRLALVIGTGHLAMESTLRIAMSFLRRDLRSFPQPETTPPELGDQMDMRVAELGAGEISRARILPNRTTPARPGG